MGFRVGLSARVNTSTLKPKDAALAQQHTLTRGNSDHIRIGGTRAKGRRTRSAKGGDGDCVREGGIIARYGLTRNVVNL